MKQRSLSVLTIIFSLCLLLFACRKEISFMIHDRDHASAGLLESAKVWYLQHIDPQTPKIQKYGVLRVHWKNAWTRETPSNGTILIVPAQDYYLSDQDYTFKRFLTFKISDNIASQGRIIELLGKNYDVDDNLDFLTKSYNQDIITGFNGTILQYDVSYRKIKSTTYRKGEKKERITGSFISFSKEQLKQIKKREAERSNQRKDPNSSDLGRYGCSYSPPVYSGFPEHIGEDCTVTAWQQITYDPDGCIIRM